MGRVTRMQSKVMTLLESAIRLQGEFRRILEPIQVTPLQAAMILFLRRHEDGRVSDLAIAFSLKLPTVVQVVHDLEHNGWVTKRQSVQDRRAVFLRLSRQGQALAQKIEAQVERLSDGVVYTRRSNHKVLAKEK